MGDEGDCNTEEEEDGVQETRGWAEAGNCNCGDDDGCDDHNWVGYDEEGDCNTEEKDDNGVQD